MNSIFIGKTEAGKTFLAKEMMLKSNKGALFVNYVDPEKDKRFEQVDRFTDELMIKNLLRHGRKVQYNVTKDFDLEVTALYFMLRDTKNFIFAIDEVHLLKNKTKELVSNLWKVGRHNGIDAYGITQRPQELDRAMTTQSKYLYIFKSSMEDAYFKSYGIDPTLIPQEVHKHIVIER